MIIYKLYAIVSIWCSILSQQICWSNNCSYKYNMHLISPFDNPDEPVNTINPTMRIFVPCWNHHRIFLSLGMYNPLLSLPASLRKGWYLFPVGRHSWNWRIWFTGVQLKYNTGNISQSALGGVIEVTVRILDPDVMRFRHDPLVGIAIIYLGIKSQMLNRCRAVEWLTVVQQPTLKFNKYNVYEYILIISEHQSTNFMSPVLLSLCME